MRIVKSMLRLAGSALLFAASISAVHGAGKRVKLTGDTCDYVLTYDPSKVSETQVKNTFDLLILPQNQVFGPSVFSVEAAKAIDLKKIDRDCAEAIDKLKNLQLYPLDGLDALRAERIAETEDSCRYDRLEAQGFANPSVLRSYEPAAACFKYVDALEGKSDLTAMFESISRDQCKNNASPADCLARAKKDVGNDAAMKIAVQNFGWGNCAIEFNLRNTAHNDTKAQKLGKAFLKALKARQVDCEAP